MADQPDETASNVKPPSAFDRIDQVLAGASDAGEERISLGAMTEALEERAFGMLLLALALPCCLPFLYGVPQVVALPMLVLAGQMAAGRHAPWLPKALGDRTIEIAGMRQVVARGKQWFGWAERIATPRLLGLTAPTMTRLIGAVLLVPCASILVPLPLTNTTPGIGVAIASIGLIERDGLLLVAGLAIGFLWVAFLLIGGPLIAVWTAGALGF